MFTSRAINAHHSTSRGGGRSKELASLHPADPHLYCKDTTASAIVRMFLSLRVKCSLSDRRKLFPDPTQGSMPTFTDFPFPIFQANHCPTKGKANTKGFHLIDTFLWDIFDSLNQEIIDKPGKYFAHKTLLHREFRHSVNLHNYSKAREREKNVRYFMPQPPKYLGCANADHLTRGIPSTLLL